MKPLIARFRPQAWVDNHAVDTDGAVNFDATARLLELPLEAIQQFKENNYDSDYLAGELPERQSHRGPFEVDTDIDCWLEENGVEGGRTMLTQDHLNRLWEEKRGQ